MTVTQRKILVILGPTASGKSDLAVKVARWLGKPAQKKAFGIDGAEIISADSRQVYKGLDIGTGKITKREMRGVLHHLLDVASPKRKFTAAQYQKLARQTIARIHRKNKLPILVGGTGLYIDATLYDYPLPSVKPNITLRRELERLSVAQLFSKLKTIDPQRAATIDPHNPRRLVRALEIVMETNAPVPQLPADLYSRPLYRVLKIGIAPAENLNQKIRARLRKWIRQGLAGEIRRLRARGVSWQRFEELGLEYKWFARYLQGKTSPEECLRESEQEIVRYAKRQMTWFRKDKNILWIHHANEAILCTKSFLQNS